MYVGLPAASEVRYYLFQSRLHPSEVDGVLFYGADVENGPRKRREPPEMEWSSDWKQRHGVSPQLWLWLSRPLVPRILMQSRPPGLTGPPTPALFTVHLIRLAWPCVCTQGRAGKIRVVSAHKNPTPALKFPARCT
ncbi:unnamed protein product [Rangifer tarandus platyrhynchus]|uniref:Uncharacterized protein n=1 Tax=Rangifer tarandus platyrhynchus TaxID=3082113 RepID=A0AC59Z197_RANTA